jgi:multidrug efflux pump subunit AcrA (membrane-fusion protein)
MKRKIKKILYIFLPLLIIGLIIFAFLKPKKDKIEYVTYKVEKGTLTQTVNDTGTVKPVQELDLNFLTSGKISKINVKVGDEVFKDQILAELDDSSISFKLKEAEAGLIIAKTNLNRLLAGASKEDLNINKAGVEQAQASYNSAIKEYEKVDNSTKETISQAEKNLNDLKNNDQDAVTTYKQAVINAENNLKNIKNVYQKSIDNKITSLLLSINTRVSVANTALDIIDRILKDNDAKDVLGVKNSNSLNETKSSYEVARNSLNDLKERVSINISDIKEVNNDYELAINSLNLSFEALSDCFNLLENTVVSTVFTQTDLDGFKSSTDLQIANISSSISQLQLAKQSLDDAVLAYDSNVSSANDNLAQTQVALDNAVKTAQNSLVSAQNNRDQQLVAAQSKIDAAEKSLESAKAQLKKISAVARVEDIELSKAQVMQAEASLASIKSQLDNFTIKSPIDGVITKINYQIGEQFSSSPVIEMLSDDFYELNIDVAETDISKIKINDPAEITLDAYGDATKFNGKIVFVDPAETNIQGVVHYKVKINFDAGDKEIKSGMTANATITTAVKNNVIMIPNRAIIEKDNSKMVRILINNEIFESPVQTGLFGDDGLVEILSGVKEGDEVVTFIKEN